MIHPIIDESETDRELPSLERACFFASLCSVGKFRRLAKWWTDYALVLAARLRGRARSPRDRC